MRLITPVMIFVFKALTGFFNLYLLSTAIRICICLAHLDAFTAGRLQSWHSPRLIRLDS